MDIDQWRREVGAPLNLIAAGADMCARHVEQLPIRPPKTTEAEHEMRRAEAVLVAALTTIRLALTLYREKETGE